MADPMVITSHTSNISMFYPQQQQQQQFLSVDVIF